MRSKLVAKGLMLIVSILASSANAQGNPDPKCNDILPVEEDVRIAFKEAWEKTQEQGGTNVKLGIPNVFEFEFGKAGDKYKDIGSKDYNYQKNQRILAEPQGQLGLACAIGACKGKYAGWNDESVDRFISFCFGYPPKEGAAASTLRLANPVLDISVARGALGQQFPKQLEINNSGEVATAVSAFRVPPNSKLSLNMSKKDQQTKLDRKSKTQLTLQIKAPSTLGPGQVLQSVYFLDINNAPTLVGMVRVMLEGPCREGVTIGKDTFCTKCEFRFPIEAATQQMAIPGGPWYCPNMPPGHAVTATFTAKMRQDNSGNDPRRQIQAAFWFADGVTTVTPNLVDKPQLTPVTAQIASTVPTKQGIWGSAGTVSASWNLQACLWWASEKCQTCPGTCSAPEGGTIVIRAAP
jgi:hypothetical protein